MVPTRLGLIVPSSNTTMETELPEMFARRARSSCPRSASRSTRAGCGCRRSRPRRCCRWTATATGARSSSPTRSATRWPTPASSRSCRRDRVRTRRRRSGSRRSRATRGATFPVVSSAGALLRGLAALGAAPDLDDHAVRPGAHPEGRRVHRGRRRRGRRRRQPRRRRQLCRRSASIPWTCRRSPPAWTAAVATRSCCPRACRCPRSPRSPRSKHGSISRCSRPRPSTTYDLLTALGRSTVVPDAGHLLSKEMAASCV